MPRDQKELDKLLKEQALQNITDTFKLKSPEEQLGISIPVDGIATKEYKTMKTPPVQSPQYLEQDPSINYGTVQRGRDMLKQMDSPEYRTAQDELMKLNRNVMGLPEGSRTPEMMQQLEMKRKALEMLRRGIK